MTDLSRPATQDQGGSLFGKSSLFDAAYAGHQSDEPDFFSQATPGYSPTVPTLPTDLDYLYQKAIEDSKENKTDNSYAGSRNSAVSTGANVWSIDDLQRMAGGDLDAGDQYGGSQYGGSQYGGSQYGGSQYGGSQYGDVTRQNSSNPYQTEASGGSQPEDTGVQVHDFYKSRRHKKMPKDNLGLTGDLEFRTSSAMSYHSHSREDSGYGEGTNGLYSTHRPGSQRPRDNLGSYGHMDFTTDKSQYGGHTIERQRSSRPSNNLGLQGDMDFTTEKSQYSNTSIQRTRSGRPSNQLSVQGDMDFTTEKSKYDLRSHSTEPRERTNHRSRDNLRSAHSDIKLDARTTHSEDYEDYTKDFSKVKESDLRPPPKWYVPPKPDTAK